VWNIEIGGLRGSAFLEITVSLGGGCAATSQERKRNAELLGHADSAHSGGRGALGRIPAIKGTFTTGARSGVSAGPSHCRSEHQPQAADIGCWQGE
jgi:hypothetical protein